MADARRSIGLVGIVPISFRRGQIPQEKNWTLLIFMRAVSHGINRRVEVGESITDVMIVLVIGYTGRRGAG